MAETVGKITKACEQAQKCNDNSSMKLIRISVLFLGLPFLPSRSQHWSACQWALFGSTIFVVSLPLAAFSAAPLLPPCDLREKII